MPDTRSFTRQIDPKAPIQDAAPEIKQILKETLQLVRQHQHTQRQQISKELPGLIKRIVGDGK